MNYMYICVYLYLYICVYSIYLFIHVGVCVCICVKQTVLKKEGFGSLCFLRKPKLITLYRTVPFYTAVFPHSSSVEIHIIIW